MATGAAVGALAGFFVRELDLLALFSYWGDHAWLVVAGCVVGALAWGTPLRAGILTAVTILGALFLIVAFTPVTRAMGDGLARRDVLEKTDGVFVLASALQTDGEPTAPALARLVHGIELVGQGYAPRLILTEMPPSTRRYADVARPLLAHLGLTADVVAVGPVHTTREEAQRVGALCRERGWRTLLVVTSPWHSRRACGAVEREGVRVVASPAIETQFDAEMLDRPDARLFAFGRALHERVGLWYYARRGWLPAR